MNKINTISFIGAGNVAWHLAKELKKNNFIIETIFSRTIISAKLLANEVDAEATTNIQNIHPSDLTIISIPDDAIIEIAKTIKLKQGIAVHTSGTQEMDSLKSVSDEFGVFYPLQTFSKNRNVEFDNLPICIEGNNSAVTEALEYVAGRITKNLHRVNSEKRMVLHVAAVFACNFTNFMYSVSSDILKKEQLDFEILKPLIAETAQKVMKLNPTEAQTGPALRNDIKTIVKHREYLSNFPEFEKIYNFVTEKIQSKKHPKT